MTTTNQPSSVTQTTHSSVAQKPDRPGCVTLYALLLGAGALFIAIGGVIAGLDSGSPGIVAGALPWLRSNSSSPGECTSSTTVHASYFSACRASASWSGSCRPFRAIRSPWSGWSSWAFLVLWLATSAKYFV